MENFIFCAVESVSTALFCTLHLPVFVHFWLFFGDVVINCKVFVYLSTF